MLEPNDVEMHIWSLFARLALTGRDRTGDPAVEVDQGTGLPVSANDLLAKHQAVTGQRLALSYLLIPRRLAAGILGRNAEGKRVCSLGSLPESEWTQVELEHVESLEYRIKVQAHKIQERSGTAEHTRPFVLTPEGGNHSRPGEALALGDDGLTRAIQITHRGLEMALEKVRGTKWERGPRSMRQDVGEEKWATAPQWAKDQEAAER